MHTTKDLKSTDFQIERENELVQFDDVLQRFSQFDRIGIIVRQPCGSIGASAFLLATITRFYDFFRPQLGNGLGQIRIYPEVFVFHVGKKQMDHYWLDIWPPHKEVVVEDESEQILQAVNDRGITRLLIEEMPHCINPVYLPETLTSAKNRITSAFVYSKTGRVRDPDISITSCEMAENYVLKSLTGSDNLSLDKKDELLRQRKQLKEGRFVKETYRTATFQEAVRMLTPSTDVSELTKQYIALS
ncbi:hypothetical protein N0O92_14020 [Alkalihalobacillus sp. MEB130]|uniref:hypothetical protein n=1 Tax=Alkalihalobacillus sp. MEB130 TaxID=2976704 RepID=UPI0028DEC84F|nr:hypothetical protein [Alkalihalobacillus sp. MEB130]MDT8861352.1 hypothetical protein [Alkalihalobacillus sp. MEB130]